MPDGPQPNADGGQNRKGNPPQDGSAGQANPGEGDAQWGQLQPYVNFLKNRGSPPKVPEKFRHYFEAYLKNQQGKKQ